MGLYERFMLLGLAMLIGLIPAAIAYDKGRSFIGWWLFGAALFHCGPTGALIIQRDTDALEVTPAGDGDEKVPILR